VLLNVKKSDTVISKILRIINVLSTKLVYVQVKIIAFSNEHYELVQLSGNPLGKIINIDENSFVAFKIKELLPREEKNIRYKLALARKKKPVSLDLLKCSFNDMVSEKLYRVNRNAFSYATRRARNVAERLKRKSKNILDFQTLLLQFFGRNIACSYNDPIDPDSIFERNHGHPKDLTFAFSIFNMIAGIPSRLIEGYLIEKNNSKGHVKRHYWCEISIFDEWIPIDPCFRKILIPLPNNYIPIKVEHIGKHVRNVSTQFKSVKPTLRKAVRIEEEEIVLTVNIDSAPLIGKTKNI